MFRSFQTLTNLLSLTTLGFQPKSSIMGEGLSARLKSLILNLGLRGAKKYNHPPPVLSMVMYSCYVIQRIIFMMSQWCKKWLHLMMLVWYTYIVYSSFHFDHILSHKSRSIKIGVADNPSLQNLHRATIHCALAYLILDWKLLWKLSSPENTIVHLKYHSIHESEVCAWGRRLCLFARMFQIGRPLCCRFCHFNREFLHGS